MQLTINNHTCEIDDEDYEALHVFHTPSGNAVHLRICDLSWNAIVSSDSPTYAVASVNKQMVRMHRLVMDCPRSQMVDHRDGNGLNNIRENLRIATSRQNAMNRSRWKNSSSRFKGVHRDGKRWRAIITVLGKRINLGAYGTDVEAAEAYNRAAFDQYGEFARLNDLSIATNDSANHRPSTAPCLLD